jgi:hypothetical protein
MDQTPRTGTEPTQATQPAVGWSPPPPARRDGGFDFSDFISFRYLITPGFITIIYVIGAIVITIGALSALAAPGNAQGGLLYAIVVFVIGQLWWRIVLEFVMVLFRINDSLASIDRRDRGM